MEATSDGGVTPAGSVDLAPGEDANFDLELGTVPQSFDVIIAELVTDQSAAIELRNAGYWGVISSSVSLDRFVRGVIGGVPPASTAASISRKPLRTDCPRWGATSPSPSHSSC